MKSKSAIFVVSSPLQALCAVEACMHYSINKCKFYIIDDGRLKQVVSYLKSCNFDYTILDKRINIIKLLQNIICYVLPLKNSYDYLFLGNVYMLKYIFLFLPNLRRKAWIVYLDDGNNILGYINENKKLSLSREVLKKIIIVLSLIKQIKNNVVFSIFADELKNPKYLIEKNSLNLLKSKNHGCNDTVYVIGTYIDDFCDVFGISRALFIQKLNLLFSIVQKRFPEKKITYVPHGREPINKEFVQFCLDSGVEFLKLNECVEIYLTTLDSIPEAIFGFGSTALFTLRKIYPNVPVINVFLNDSKKVIDDYRVIYETYQRVNIELLKI